MTIFIPPRVRDIPVAQFDILNSRAAELRAQGHAVISLGQALPGFGPPKAALDAAAAALTDPATHIYSADAGEIELREALCAYLSQRHQIGATPQDVIVTAGGNQAFMLAALTVLSASDEVLLPAPFFANHDMAIRAVGAVPIEVPLAEAHGFVLRWADLEPHLTPRTRAVVVCTPSNPTGATVDPVETARTVTALAGRDIAVFSDETYMDFMFPPGEAKHWSLASLPAWRDNVILLGTCSKSFGMTGWRVGYMVADARVVDQAIKIQDAMIICAPVVAQRAVRAAVQQAPDHAIAFLPTLAARRALLAARVARIPRLRWTPTAGGFFAFVHVDGCRDSVALCADILERAHVVTIPGAIFGKAGEGYLRLSFGAATESQINEAFDRLERYF